MYEATIKWFDGGTSTVTPTPIRPGKYAINASHTFKKAGNSMFSITVRRTDHLGAGNGRALVQMAHVTVDADGGGFLGDCSGVDVTDQYPIGSFTSLNPYAEAGDFDAIIHWGDGSTSGATALQRVGEGPTFDVYAAHHYDAAYGGGGSEDPDHPEWETPFCIEVRENNAIVGAAGGSFFLTANGPLEARRTVLEFPVVPSGEGTPPGGPASPGGEDPTVTSATDGGLTVEGQAIEAVEGESLEGTVLATVTDSADDPNLTAESYHVQVSGGPPGSVLSAHLEGGDGSYTLVADADSYIPKYGRWAIQISVSADATETTDGRSCSVTSRAAVDDAPITVYSESTNDDHITSGETRTVLVGTLTDENRFGQASELHAMLIWQDSADGTSTPCTIQSDGDGKYKLYATVTLYGDIDGAAHLADLYDWSNGGSDDSDAVELETYKSAIRPEAGLTWEGMDQIESDDPGGHDAGEF